MRSETTTFWLQAFKTKPPEVNGANQAKIGSVFFQFPPLFHMQIDGQSEMVMACYVGEGGFNLVYRCEINGNDVALRISWPTDRENHYPYKAESQERLLKIWNELYPDLFSFQAQGITLTDSSKRAWSAILMPFIEGVEPTPQEIKLTMLEDFKNTGRVPPDGCVFSNYKKTPSGKIICVDPIFSLRRAPHETLCEDGTVFKREASQESIEFWNAMKPAYGNVHFWNHSSFTKTEKIIIVLTIKALLLLQDIQLSSQDFLALKTTAREDNNDVFAFLGRIFDEEPRTQPGFICRGENTITPFTLLHFQKILGILDAVGLFSKDKNVSLIGKNDILSLLAGISRVQNACNNKLHKG